jgi:hypothetical protein
MRQPKTKTDGFTLKRVQLTENGFTYETFRLVGWLNGERIRRQFKSRDEALGEKNRLEVQAANSGEITARNTRLSSAQLADAEAAYARLGPRSLSEAVAWYLANYRPPQVATLIEIATAAFLADRANHARAIVLRGYRHTMKDLDTAFAGRSVHEISTADVSAFLVARKVGKKRFNNLRGELHTFFAWCKTAPRGWTSENPVTAIPAFRIAHGVPEILTAQKAAEIMAYVETYTGGLRELPAGCLAPYFAICLFGGVRPAFDDGEIAKLAKSPDSVNLALGTIRLSPDQSKVKAVRQITIQPNLRAWLERFPLNKFPILPLGARRMIAEIRQKFGIGQDVLRHSFISFHCAKFKSMGAAALEAGNSEAMIRRHYLNVVTESEAVAFWRIAPLANP